MIQKYTLHTHTIGFDGRNYAQDMAFVASRLGFDTIGISNHFIVNPEIKNSTMYSYAIRGGYTNIYATSFKEAMSRFVPHYTELQHAQEQHKNIKILRGLEVDFFDDIHWLNGFEKALEILQPDYLIGSTHFVSHNGKILNMHDLVKADSDTQDVLLQKYWTNIAKAAESGLFTWMAHLDLPKKVGLGRAEKWAEYESRAVESAAKSNTAIEINTSFYKKDCYEPYPSDRILQMVAQNNVPVLISDDAHVATDIGRHFDDAQNLINKFNLKRFQR